MGRRPVRAATASFSYVVVLRVFLTVLVSEILVVAARREAARMMQENGQHMLIFVAVYWVMMNMA